MKVTPKFQKGGSFDNLFTTYTPIQIESPQGGSQRRASRREDSDDEKGKLTEKDFFNMIKDINGLPNEMMSLVTSLTDTFRMSNLTGIDPSSLTTTYLQSLYQVKLFSQNKEKFDKAIGNAGVNGSLGEPAISMDGKLIIQDENGKLKTIKLDTYFDNPEQYQGKVMTVSNLAYYRQYDPSLVNDQRVFDIIDNSVGFESFQKLIDQAKINLGSSEYKSNGMFQYDAKAIQGLKVIQSLQENDQARALGAITAEGLYEYNIIDKTKLGQIKALTTYIKAIIPDRAKTWAAFKLNTSDKDKATEDLVFQYLLSGNTTSHSFDINYKGTMDHVMGKSSKSGSQEEPEMTYLTAIQGGYGGRRERRTLNFGDNVNFYVNGTAQGGFLDQDGKTISNLTLEELLNKTGLIGVTNSNSITFGDNILNPNILSKVAIQNTGGITAILPCIKEGNSVVPNFELMEGFSKALDEVYKELGDINPDSTPEQLAQYQQKRMDLLSKKIQSKPELQELLDITGRIDESKFANFFIVDGLASDLNVSFTTRTEHGTVSISDKDNILLSQTRDASDNQYFKEITKQDKFDDYDGFGIMDSIFGYDKLYKSKVFIPIQTTNRLAAMLFSKQRLKDSTAMRVEQEVQQAQVSNLAPTNTTLLTQ